MSDGLRVFIVDDDRDLAESLADLLEGKGHSVELAFDGARAIEIFRSRDFDIVFMDVKMPGMSGVETFFEFRRIKPDARVVMMTGFSVEQLLQEAVSNGALGVLHKPFSPDEVMAMLEQVKPQGIVLVADDNPDFAQSIEPVLGERGYRVAVARTGQDALDRVLAGGIDCLILDLRLPVLNGLEVYLSLKKAGRAVPTIIVTGYAEEEKESLAVLRPMAEAVLMKPFDPTLLLERIDSARRSAA
ncbi:MAG TPA: response regulator [Stellaceae bacterium]|nr:response regulator [Stellaceae bacterium]